MATAKIIKAINPALIPSAEEKEKLTVMPKIIVGTEAPVNPQPGDLWIDTNQ